MRYPRLLLAAAGALLGATHAKATAQVHGTGSIAYLYSTGWPEGRRDVLTAEFASTWSGGDHYVLLEATHLLTRTPDVSPTDLFGVWSPRFSLRRLLGLPRGMGPLEDILTAHELDVEGDGRVAHLHGVGLSWRAPGLTFLVTNALVRDDLDQPGVTWDFVLAGEATGRVGAWWTVYTYAVFSGAEGALASSVYAETQALAGLRGAGGTPSLWVGLELHVSRNRGGIRGRNDIVPQLIGKWVIF